MSIPEKVALRHKELVNQFALTRTVERVTKWLEDGDLIVAGKWDIYAGSATLCAQANWEVGTYLYRVPFTVHVCPPPVEGALATEEDLDRLALPQRALLEVLAAETGHPIRYSCEGEGYYQFLVPLIEDDSYVALALIMAYDDC